MMGGKFKLPLAAFLVLVLLGMSGTAAAQAPGWSLKTVIGAAGAGDCPVTRLDAQDNPHILYFDANVKSLFYTRFTGVAWTVPVEVDHTYAGHVLCLGGLALQSNGQPAVVYVTDDGHLVFAWMSGANFQRHEIVLPLTGPMHSPNLVFAPGDVPQIVYVQNTNLVYVYPVGGTWQFERPAKNAAGDLVLVGDNSPVNLLRDAQGRLHFSYYCMKHYPWYLTRPAAGFVLPVRMDVDAMKVDDAKPSVALALDAAGLPHVAATVGVNPQLKLYSRPCATCAWTGQVLDQLPDTAITSAISGVRLAYDTHNLPLLSYYYKDASSTGGLRLLTFNGQFWQKIMVDNRAGYGQHNWLTVSRANRPGISYYAGGAGGLVYASGASAIPLAMPYQYYLARVGKQ